MKTHRTDPISLTFGLLFLGLAGWWWVSDSVSLTAATAGWITAIALVALGTVGIVTSIRGGRTRSSEPRHVEEEPEL